MADRVTSENMQSLFEGMHAGESSKKRGQGEASGGGGGGGLVGVLAVGRHSNKQSALSQLIVTAWTFT